ncbi:dTDP-6-deoxy-L-hexose 3-O-methyltransferase, partial [bacterium]|nr:dTDP-6-deoxy-L-hexose 3-O-methyltransferase [bacterium]
GFDTFTGYPQGATQDKDSEIFKCGNYQLDENYDKFLEELLLTHEKCNILGNVHGNHQIIKGDVSSTIKDYFNNYPHELVALAYFDMGLYEPTKIALQEIIKHCVPGSIILLDQLTWKEAPGEALAFKEVFKNIPYKIESSKYTPMRNIITLL